MVTRYPVPVYGSDQAGKADPSGPPAVPQEPTKPVGTTVGFVEVTVLDRGAATGPTGDPVQGNSPSPWGLGVSHVFVAQEVIGLDEGVLCLGAKKAHQKNVTLN